MNMNGSLYANAQSSMADHFDVDIQKTTYGNMAFLISYAFGCELWAPWSEELGRKWPMQASLTLVTLITALIPRSPNFATVLILRILTGLATAGGSLTLGVAADMYKSHQQQHPVAFIAWGSMLGSALPPIAGWLPRAASRCRKLEVMLLAHRLIQRVCPASAPLRRSGDLVQDSSRQTCQETS